jgi:hypothetical protein
MRPFLFLAFPALLAGCVTVERTKPYPATLRFTGNAIFTEDALRKVATDAKCTDSITCEIAIEAVYMEQGYVTANLRENDEETGIFTVSEGPRFSLGAITIVERGEGAAATPLFAAADFPMKTGAVLRFSETKAAMEVIRKKYEAAGFPYVNVIPITNLDAEAARVDMTIEISRDGRRNDEPR